MELGKRNIFELPFVFDTYFCVNMHESPNKGFEEIHSFPGIFIDVESDFDCTFVTPIHCKVKNPFIVVFNGSVDVDIKYEYRCYTNL